MKVSKYITIGVYGSRLKCLSSLEKQNLYWWDKTILEWNTMLIPDIQLLGHDKTTSRKETLMEIKDMENVLIVDCDIIPFQMPELTYETDEVVCFISTKKKWGSVLVENGVVVESNEKPTEWNTKLSGVYFIKSMKTLLENMDNPNSIISGMDKPKVYYENTFVRLGDRTDYMENIKIECV